MDSSIGVYLSVCPAYAQGTSKLVPRGGSELDGLAQLHRRLRGVQLTVPRTFYYMVALVYSTLGSATLLPHWSYLLIDVEDIVDAQKQRGHGDSP